MFNSGVLDVLIGLVFVYLILSLFCTAANEWIAGWTKLRARTLEKGIRQLVGDRLAKKLYDHALVKPLGPPGGGPSYLPSRVFALALLDEVAGGAHPRAQLRDVLAELPGDLSKALLPLLRAAGESAEGFQQRIENWFDDAMDRVSGWYKRRMQAMTLVVAAVVTVGANADTFSVVNRLWTNPTLRAKIVELAKVRAQQPPPLNVEYTNPESPEASPPQVSQPAAPEPPEFTPGEKQAIGELLSWKPELTELKGRVKTVGSFAGLGSWLGWLLGEHIFGWLLTVIALTLGAPFWFDILKDLVNLRSAGRVPAESKKQTPEPGR